MRDPGERGPCFSILPGDRGPGSLRKIRSLRLIPHSSSQRGLAPFSSALVLMTAPSLIDVARLIKPYGLGVLATMVSTRVEENTVIHYNTAVKS